MSDSEKRETIRVVLTDDHPIVRGGVKNMLIEQDDIDVVGEASDGAEALKLVRSLEPDVLLLDMEMPVKPGIEVAKDLAKEEHPTRILALSAYDDDEYIFGLLDAGASSLVRYPEAPASSSPKMYSSSS